MNNRPWPGDEQMQATLGGQRAAPLKDFDVLRAVRRNAPHANATRPRRPVRSSSHVAIVTLSKFHPIPLAKAAR